MEPSQRQIPIYDPRVEHDACGIGAVVNLKGAPSHATVDSALKIVEKLEHRAGKDASGETGDGVGLMIQVPHKLMVKVAAADGIDLGGPRDYGVGMFFFPADKLKRAQAQKMLEIIAAKEGLTFLGWREVPTHPEVLGQKALDCMPCICQCFVARPADCARGLDFDRKLYVVRREFEQSNVNTYICSFSSRTIVYKGMFLVGQLRKFYADLTDSDCESAIALVHSRFSTNTTPAGSGLIPTATSSTTARSTPSGAMWTGCWPGRRPCTPRCWRRTWTRSCRWWTRAGPTPPCWTTPWSSWS